MKNLSDCRVLIVDDARANVDILVDALKRDYKLTIALNGDMALKSVARAAPDLVLLDIMMPEMDGYEVCRRMRRMPEMADVPIVFLSALDEARNKAQGFEAGANDYVTKPFDTLEIQARARYLLRAKAYTDAAKEQLAADLRVAREIQMGMIIHDFSALERFAGVEFAGVLEPAREVGGDLFGAFAVDNQRLVLVMGDVSGKGIPASLFMVRTGTLVRLLARQIREPERILQALNDELSADNPSGMFVTLVCAVFEPATGRLLIANGGQTPPVLLRPGEPPRWMVSSLGTALGLESGLSFDRAEMTLRDGDSLIFYTDGVTEAFNVSEECYGNVRLMNGIESGGPAPAALLAKRIRDDVRSFAQEAPQSDDIALLVMRVTVPPGILLDLPATPASVMQAVDALEEFCRKQNLPESAIFGLKLALEEATSNIVNHAYQKDSRQKFTVTIARSTDWIIVRTRDRGPAFNPLRQLPPIAERDPGAIPEGGVGIYLTHHYVDELHYTREGDENVLHLARSLAHPRPDKPDAPVEENSPTNLSQTSTQ